MTPLTTTSCPPAKTILPPEDCVCSGNYRVENVWWNFIEKIEILMQDETWCDLKITLSAAGIRINACSRAARYSSSFQPVTCTHELQYILVKKFLIYNKQTKNLLVKRYRKILCILWIRELSKTQHRCIFKSTKMQKKEKKNHSNLKQRIRTPELVCYEFRSKKWKISDVVNVRGKWIPP